MDKTVDVPIENLQQLNLQDGEKVIGEQCGNVVRFTVIKVTRANEGFGRQFVEKWSGILKGEKDQVSNQTNESRMSYYNDKYQLGL